MWAREELSDVETDEVELVHVYPIGMGKEHDTDHGFSCWCWPEPDAECPYVVVHNVMN